MSQVVSPENIGALHDAPDVDFATKVDRSERILFKLLDGEPPALHEIGKALCWLGYRHIEGKYQNRLLILDALPEAFKRVSVEENQFHHYRWHSSLMTLRTYLLIKMGALERPRFLDGASIFHNPFTMVNVSRLLMIRAGDAIRRADTNEAADCIRRLHGLWPRFAALVPMDNVAACAGHEVCCVARMLHVSFMLLPHAKMPFQGAVYDLETVAGLETVEPFRGCFRQVLGLPPAG